MTQVLVVCEGQTEQSFVGDVLAPFLAEESHVLIGPRMIPTSRRRRGGGLTRDRIMRYFRNTLRERDDTYITTLFDLYGLVGDFPGLSDADGLADPIERAVAIETAFRQAVVREAGCRPERFIPHVQPYEFESLLFSDVERFAEVEPAWQAFVRGLHAVRESAASPEHINNGRNTHPSAPTENAPARDVRESAARKSGIRPNRRRTNPRRMPSLRRLVAAHREPSFAPGSKVARTSPRAGTRFTRQ